MSVQMDLWLLMDMEQDGGDTASTLAILVAIEASKTPLMGSIDTLAMECGLIRQDLDHFRGRITLAENRMLKNSLRISSLCRNSPLHTSWSMPIESQQAEAARCAA